VNRCYCPSEEVAKRAALDNLQPSQIRVFGLPIQPSFCLAVLVKAFSSSKVSIFLFLLILVRTIRVFQKAEIFILQGFVLLCSMNMLYTPKVLLFKFQENRKICLCIDLSEYYSAVINFLCNLKCFFGMKPLISG
jgi:hypothetical protein